MGVGLDPFALHTGEVFPGRMVGVFPQQEFPPAHDEQKGAQAHPSPRHVVHPFGGANGASHRKGPFPLSSIPIGAESIVRFSYPFAYRPGGRIVRSMSGSQLFCQCS